MPSFQGIGIWHDSVHQDTVLGLQHLKLCLILFLSEFYLPCEKRWAPSGKLVLFFQFLVLNVFVSLMLRKHTLWLNFLSYKRPQCTSYPFLPVAKYFDLWRLGLLRESNKILANIISFFLHHPFLPFKKRSSPFIYCWCWKVGNLAIFPSYAENSRYCQFLFNL